MASARPRCPPSHNSSLNKFAVLATWQKAWDSAAFRTSNSYCTEPITECNVILKIHTIYNKVQYSTIQCNAVQYSTVQYSWVEYSHRPSLHPQAAASPAEWYIIIQCNILQYVLQCNMVQYSILQYSTIQYYTIQYNTSLVLPPSLLA